MSSNIFSFKHPVIGILGLAAAGCQTSALSQSLPTAMPTEQANLFEEATSDITFENVNRRKWDNAIIADLDQDGFQDLLLTDHGYSIKLYWNNKGKYAKGTDLIVGDMHGITVGDYNSDGEIDILISRGGGSGSNARNAKVFHVSKNRQITDAIDFKEDFKKMRGRTTKFVDGDNDGDLDLFLTGIPLDFSDPDGANYTYENDGKGEFVFKEYLPRTLKEGHRILVTDFNNDNIADLVFYGFDRITLLEGQGDLKYKDVSDSLFKFDNKVGEITSIAEIDFDNDGDLDLYVTRAKDIPHGATFYDSEHKTLAFYARRAPLRLEDLELGEVLDIENYQAAWPDLPVWVGESGYQLKFDGETHSGQDIHIVSSDALGWPDKQDKQGLHFGYIGNDKWRLETRSNPIMTGVIHNVPSYPDYEFEAGPQDMLLENTGAGFVDVTQKANLIRNDHTRSVAVGDYDNDGHQDLLIVRQGNPAQPNKSLLYFNQGDGTFKERDHHGVISNELGATGLGVETLDYNKDGRLDVVINNERGKWHLFKNKAALLENAHYITLNIGPSPSGKASALGASVTLKACGKSPIQRVGGSSSPYSQSFNTQLHFGLGACSQDITATVNWSDGGTVTQSYSKVDMIHTIGGSSQD